MLGDGCRRQKDLVNEGTKDHGAKGPQSLDVAKFLPCLGTLVLKGRATLLGTATAAQVRV